MEISDRTGHVGGLKLVPGMECRRDKAAIVGRDRASATLYNVPENVFQYLVSEFIDATPLVRLLLCCTLFKARLTNVVEIIARARFNFSLWGQKCPTRALRALEMRGFLNLVRSHWSRDGPAVVCFAAELPITRHVLAVACGAHHTVLTTIRGVPYSRGDNSKGQCGVGGGHGSDIRDWCPMYLGEASRSIYGDAADHQHQNDMRVHAVAAGCSHSLLLVAFRIPAPAATAAGGTATTGTAALCDSHRESAPAALASSRSWRVLSCGDNSRGQLGLGRAVAGSALPRAVCHDPYDIGSENGELGEGQSGMLQVVALFSDRDADHSVALRADGSALMWGRNSEKQCFDALPTPGAPEGNVEHPFSVLGTSDKLSWPKLMPGRGSEHTWRMIPKFKTFSLAACSTLALTNNSDLYLAGGEAGGEPFTRLGERSCSVTYGRLIAASLCLKPTPCAYGVTSSGHLLAWDVSPCTDRPRVAMQDLGQLTLQGHARDTAPPPAQAGTQPRAPPREQPRAQYQVQRHGTAQAQTSGIGVRPHVIDIAAYSHGSVDSGLYALSSDGSISKYSVSGHRASFVEGGMEIELKPRGCCAASIHPGPASNQICVITGLPDPDPHHAHTGK